MISSRGHIRFARFVTGSRPPSGSCSVPPPRSTSASIWSRTRAIAAFDGGFSAEPGTPRIASAQRGVAASALIARRSGPFEGRRGDIVAQSQVDRRAQDAFVGDAGVPDLGDQHRPRPVRLLVGHRTLHERTARGLERRQAPRDAVELVVRKSAADVAGEAQAAILLRQADQQRAEPGPRPARLREAADDERVAPDQLQLAPLARPPPGTVRRLRVLDHEAFPPARARLREEGRAVSAHLRRQADDAVQRRRERRLQATPAFDQGQRAQIRVPVAQQIERDEGDRVGRRARDDLARVRQMNAILNPLESGGLPIGVQRDDLAVEQDRGPSAPRPRPTARAPPPGTARSCRCRRAMRSRPGRASFRAPASRSRARGCRRTSARRRGPDPTAARPPAPPASAASPPPDAATCRCCPTGNRRAARRGTRNARTARRRSRARTD